MPHRPGPKCPTWPDNAPWHRTSGCDHCASQPRTRCRPDPGRGPMVSSTLQAPGHPSPGTEKSAIFGVFLDAVVATVHHQQVLLVIKGKTSRPVKLTVTAALPAPPGEEGALFIEKGNALQSFIGDIDILLGIERHGYGPHDLAISSTTAAKIAMILFGQRAHRHPFIAHTHVDFCPGPIQHIEHPVPANSYIDRVVKPSTPQAIKADGVAVAIQIV